MPEIDDASADSVEETVMGSVDSEEEEEEEKDEEEPPVGSDAV